MSEMERNKGKLYPVGMTSELAEKYVLAKLPDATLNDRKGSPFVDWVEYFNIDPHWFGEPVDGMGLLELADQYYLVEFEINRVVDYDGFVEVGRDLTGAITYHTYHDNAGGSWVELVEERLRASERCVGS